MAVKYVTHNAAGGGDGTSISTPWTLAEAAAATPSAGDEIRICATGTYTVSAVTTLAYANGTSTAHILVTGANSSGTVDGTRPTIQATSGSSFTILSITGSYLLVRHIIVDGNSRTSITGISVTGAYSNLGYCKAINCTTYGISNADANRSSLVYNCEVTGCSGTSGFYVGYYTVMQFCEAYANTTHGFRLHVQARVIGCISSANTGASSDGFNAISEGYLAHACIAHGNGRAGFDVTDYCAKSTYLNNCFASGNGGEGFRTNGVCPGAFLFNCGGYNNTSGNYSGTNITRVYNFVSVTDGDPFTNSSGGDFSLNSTANRGALLRAAGFPGAMPRGTTTGYLDIGIAQHQDPAAGGASPRFGDMTGGLR